MVFRIGWWVLIVLTALFALNHLTGVLAFATSDDEMLMFEVFAALQILALIVLLIPYKRGERWAWWAMWVAIIPMALVFRLPPDGIDWTYLITAVVMAVAQLACLSTFRPRSGQ